MFAAESCGGFLVLGIRHVLMPTASNSFNTTVAIEIISITPLLAIRYELVPEALNTSKGHVYR